MRGYKDYELETCKAIQHDILQLGGTEWEIDSIYDMWCEWSEMCASSFLCYKQGDLEILDVATDILYEKYHGGK